MPNRITTLNEDKGKVISDLEALLCVLDKLMAEKIEVKPKAGITLAKGKPNERKIKYSEAMTFLRQLNSFFGLSGAISFGTCQTCTFWNNKGSSTGFYGSCNGKGKHAFDSCLKHSKEGGGYGL